MYKVLALVLAVPILARAAPDPASVPGAVLEVVGWVVEDAHPMRRFSVPVPAGHARFLDLGGALKVEAYAPPAGVGGLEARVRLLHAEGDSHRVLHETVAGPAPRTRWSIAYRVCGGAVTFLSPAPAEPRACPR